MHADRVGQPRWLLIAIALCSACDSGSDHHATAAGASAAGSAAVAGAPGMPAPGAGAGTSAVTGGAGLGSAGSAGAATMDSGTAVPANPIDAGARDAAAPRADAAKDAAAALDAGSTPDAGTAPADDDRCSVAVADPAHPPVALDVTGDLGTHDPSLIEEGGVFYLQQTGSRLPGKSSTDLHAWRANGTAFSANPAWIKTQVPQATDLWAPDLSHFGGQYHIYYSASTFGSNSSCIGHATRASMASGSWSDQGSVVCSNHGSNDNWNAIDPNAVVDRDGHAFLVFGSFWDGIKAIELDENGARANMELHSLASRGGGAIEAPYVVRRCGFYYLFVSFDKCCDGANSTYNIRVGRSENVLGPYVDRSGKRMLDGGGNELVKSGGSWRGPGHSAVIFSGDKAFNVFHAYRSDNGASQLRVAELVWDKDGWPISGGP